MERNAKTTAGLTGNQLKIIALIAMTCDHVGVQLFPQSIVLRCIGRLAMHIFAFMIAQGCSYTRNKARYLLQIAAVALVCQTVYFVAMGSLYQCILVTFSLSVCLIYLLDGCMKHPSVWRWGLFALAVAGAWFLSMELPAILKGTDFRIDYRFFGIMLPVILYPGKTKGQVQLLATLGLTALALDQGGIQWLGLLTLPLLWLYNGSRGKYKMKYLFYIYYPTHLAVIWLLSLMLG